MIDPLPVDLRFTGYRPESNPTISRVGFVAGYRIGYRIDYTKMGRAVNKSTKPLF
jgi:hypothetical protein